MSQMETDFNETDRHDDRIDRQVSKLIEEVEEEEQFAAQSLTRNAPYRIGDY